MISMARIVSLTVLTALIGFLGFMFFRVVSPFLLPLFLAAILAILCQPLFKHLVRRSNGRVRVAAGLTTAIVLFGFLVPLLLGITIAAIELYTYAVEHLAEENWQERVEALGAKFEDEALYDRFKPFIGDELTLEEFKERRRELQQRLVANTRESLKSVAGLTLGLAGATLDVLGTVAKALLSFLIFIVALYYFLADGPALLDAAEKLIPVHVEYQRELLQRFNTVLRAVILATFVSAIAQALATATMLYLAGMGHFFLFFTITVFTAVIPLAGTWVVWMPCVVWLFWQGNTVTALIVLVVGAAVIGTMDNLIKTYVLQSDAKLHPLLAFVSVLGGLQVWGLWGVFIGPMVASCLHALVQIFNVELTALSFERFGGKSGQGSLVLGDLLTVREPVATTPPGLLTSQENASPSATPAVTAVTRKDNRRQRRAKRRK